MATQLNNYSASEVSFNETAGTNVSILHPSVSILLTPSPGYTITSSNFSPKSPLPSNISSLTFQQSGANINAIATFTNPFTMPSSNVSIPLCINGFAELVMYSISGSITNNICNINGELPTSYSGTGTFNTTSTVITIPVNADSGYYFPTQPTLVVSTGVSSNYTITSSNSFDGDGNLIGTQFNVNYKFPNSNVSGNVLTLSACAYEIYVPSIEITGYSINTASIIPAGETRTMQVFGNEGAVFTVSMNGTNLVSNVTMGATGVYAFDIIFPTVTSNTTYTITLSGDLASPFLPQNPIVIYQRLATEVTLQALFNSGIANVTPVVKSFEAFGSPTPGESAFTLDFPWTITPSPALTGNQRLALSAQPTSANWSNLNQLTNGGTLIFPVANIVLENPATSGTITVTGNIETYGGSNMTTTLDLTGLLTIVDTPSITTLDATNITSTSATGGATNISNGGLTLINKGIQWSLNSSMSPILNSFTATTSDTGNFTTSMPNLTPGTIYYVRAFATNSLGVGYGIIKQFTTTSITPLPYSYTFYYFSEDGNPNWGGFNTSGDACAATSYSATVYSNSSSIAVGMELFYDEYGTTPLNCTSFDQSGYNYYKINSTLIQFDNEGYFGGNTVHSVASCIAGYEHAFSADYSTISSGACSFSLNQTLYTNSASLGPGSIVYVDIDLTSTFIGLDRWYASSGGKTYLIQNDGLITSEYVC